MNDTLQEFRGKSAAFWAVAKAWTERELRTIIREDIDVRGWGSTEYSVTLASDREDLELATDYNASFHAERAARVAFRGREPNKSRVGGRDIRQMTLRKAGKPGNREYDKVFGGQGDYYVTAWCIVTDRTDLVAAIIVDLAALRDVPPTMRRRMEHDAMSNVPFVGYDAAVLCAHGVVRAAYPNVTYFEPFTLSHPVTPGQAGFFDGPT